MLPWKTAVLAARLFHPALAIGAAAAVGFVLVRLLKSAGSGDETASDAMPPRTGIAPSADELPIDSGT